MNAFVWNLFLKFTFLVAENSFLKDNTSNTSEVKSMLIEQDKLFIEDENTKKSDNSSIQLMVKGYLSLNSLFY